MQRSNLEKQQIPVLIHFINGAGLALFWSILFVCACDQWPRDHALIVLLAFVSGWFYFNFRDSTGMVMTSFVLTTLVFLFLIIGQSLPFIDDLTGLGITRKLDLSARLMRVAASRTDQDRRSDSFEQVGEDPLLYRRVPGSRHRYSYDGSMPLYEAVVDETGYLNSDLGSYKRLDRIDMFIAGDSVMQGTGIPSCVEKMKKSTSLSLWNLSTGSYGPRQKVGALIRFALPKHPSCLVVEFYGGNDASDINEDDVIERVNGPYEMRFTRGELGQIFAFSKKYGHLLDEGFRKQYLFTSHLRRDVFFLALGRYLFVKISSLFGLPEEYRGRPAPGALPGKTVPGVAVPAGAHFPVSVEGYPEWVAQGMRNTIVQYRRLLERVRKVKPSARVAIMYNPSSYEIYRGILVHEDKRLDGCSSYQIETLKDFASSEGIIFINLLPAFRALMERETVWLYGKTDVVHWSPMGTGIAADLIIEELRRAGLCP